VPVAIPYPDPADKAVRTYRVATNEACERALREWTAEYGARLLPFLDAGMDPDQAT
jgi:hypothetical protein